MKTKQKILASLILFGWFFAMRAPDPEVPGVFSTVITGPFAGEGICTAYQEKAEDALTQLIPGIQFRKCFFMEEA